jgi:hypothetical protein
LNGCKPACASPETGSEPAPPSGILAHSGDRVSGGPSHCPEDAFLDLKEAHLHGGGNAAGTGKTLLFGAMRWLMIALLVSVVAMLVAVAGLARHIWLQRAQLRGKPGPATNEHPVANTAVDSVEEIDPEI